MGTCVLSRFSHVRLLVTLWTAVHQARLVYGILQARTLVWVALPDLGIEPVSLISPAGAGR